MLLALSLAAEPLAPELRLDLDHPVVTANVAGVPLTLRVILDGREAIQLNPAAAQRLAVEWEEGFEAQVGRVSLEGRMARAKVVVAGMEVERPISTHDRDCCPGVDGEIGADLLPFAAVVIERAPRPGATEEWTFALSHSEVAGYYVEEDGLGVQLALHRRASIATAAVGARLGGRFEGAPRSEPVAFGVERPVRTLRLQAPATLLGLTFDWLSVRLSDFRGRRPLPTERTESEDIVVPGRASPQPAWAMVSVGQDRLDACDRIVFTARPPSLTLRCRFGEAP